MFHAWFYLGIAGFAGFLPHHISRLLTISAFCRLQALRRTLFPMANPGFHGIFSALQQGLQHALAERLLTMDDDTHDSLPHERSGWECYLMWARPSTRADVPRQLPASDCHALELRWALTREFADGLSAGTARAPIARQTRIARTRKAFPVAHVKEGGRL